MCSRSIAFTVFCRLGKVRLVVDDFQVVGGAARCCRFYTIIIQCLYCAAKGICSRCNIRDSGGLHSALIVKLEHIGSSGIQNVPLRAVYPGFHKGIYALRQTVNRNRATVICRQRAEGVTHIVLTVFGLVRNLIPRSAIPLVQLKGIATHRRIILLTARIADLFQCGSAVRRDVFGVHRNIIQPTLGINRSHRNRNQERVGSLLNRVRLVGFNNQI